MKRFALFGECLTAGVLVLLAALPVVTLLPALAAGCAHIRAHVDGETTAIRAFFTRLRSALPGSWGPSLGVLLGFGLLAVDVAIMRAGLRGGGLVGAVCMVLAAALAVVALRAAATWSPGEPWPALVRAAARRTVADPGGSIMLVMALAVLLVITWQLLPLFLPMFGCLLMAAVAVERRGVEARGHRNPAEEMSE